MLIKSSALWSLALAAPSSEYSKWIEPYQQETFDGYFGSNKRLPLKLIVTAIEHDEPKTDTNEMSGRKISYGCQVSTDGHAGWFYTSSFGHKGGGYPQLPAADFKRLNQLLEKLPGDGGRLSPPNRRLVFQVADGKRFRTYVYDRANAPDVVWEILRLSGAGICSYVPLFEPTAKWTAHRRNDGALTVSPDGKQIVSASWYEPLKFWNPQTHALDKAIDAAKEIATRRIAFSPDGLLIAVEEGSDVHLMETGTGKVTQKFVGPTVGDRTYSLTQPQFTLDGRFLLLRISDQLLRVFDVQTGKRQTTLYGLPSTATAYFSSPNGERAVYSTKETALAFWDSAKKRGIPILREKARLQDVAFSPDGSKAVIVTAEQGPGSFGSYWSILRLRVWSLETGAMLHELRPFEQRTCEAIEGVLWSSDGQYILAATKSDNFFTSRGVSIWNAQSGRHRGELTGPATNINGMAWLSDGRLVAGSNDGIIRLWDFPAVLPQIVQLERSFVSVS